MHPRLLSPVACRCFLAFLLTVPAARAEVTLHGLFTDQMVLQREASVPVWGWAAEGEKVTVEFRDQIVSTTAKGGAWMVRLKNLKPGAPAELKVTGNNTLTLKDVLVGEVWLASGQSNMEWSMRASHDPTNEIAKTANPDIRLCTVAKLKLDQPTNNLATSWRVCGPETVPGFSAVAYYFARDLQKALGVPVGIIHTSWGGSPAEVWMREDVLSASADFQRDILDAYPAAVERVKIATAGWEKRQEAATKEGKTFTERRPGLGWKPCELYNGMIAPLVPFAVQGAIWYQGESNAGRAHQYRTLFPMMVANWRKDWGQRNFTFLQVQLAPFKGIKTEPGESDWAELREAQVHATTVLPQAGIAVITDVGEENDIHPRKKEPVGARLALAARHHAYGEKLVWSGPAYRSVSFREDKAVVSFEHTGGGLVARGGELKGFAVAGEDRKFVWAKAEIDGDKVVVSNPAVARPVAVRYGWADYPVVNLWNKEGIPASPFRTDTFPMLTEGKK